MLPFAKQKPSSKKPEPPRRRPAKKALKQVGSASPFWQELELSPLNRKDVPGLPPSPLVGRDSATRFSRLYPSPRQGLPPRPQPSPGNSLHASGASAGSSIPTSSVSRPTGDPNAYPNGLRPSSLVLGPHTPNIAGAHLDRRSRSSITGKTAARRDKVLNFDGTSKVAGLTDFNTAASTINCKNGNVGSEADGSLSALTAALDTADSEMSRIKMKVTPSKLGSTQSTKSSSSALRQSMTSSNVGHISRKASVAHKQALARARVGGSEQDILGVSRTMIQQMQINLRSANPGESMSSLLKRHAATLQRNISSLLQPKRAGSEAAAGSAVEDIVAKAIREAQQSAILNETKGNSRRRNPAKKQQMTSSATVSAAADVLNAMGRQARTATSSGRPGRPGRSSGGRKTKKSKATDDKGMKPCNCKKSKCLKLYCECFARQAYCSDCNCIACHNIPEYEFERSKAVLVTLERDANAFFRGSKLGSVDANTAKHLKGCNCKKSACLKKYCECFQAKVSCSAMCKCHGCKNGKTEKPASAAAAAAVAAVNRVRQNTRRRQKKPSIISSGAESTAPRSRKRRSNTRPIPLPNVEARIIMALDAKQQRGQPLPMSKPIPVQQAYPTNHQTVNPMATMVGALPIKGSAPPYQLLPNGHPGNPSIPVVSGAGHGAQAKRRRTDGTDGAQDNMFQMPLNGPLILLQP